MASTPRPAIDRKPDASGTSPTERPAATIVRASGCSLSASTAAARRSGVVVTVDRRHVVHRRPALGEGAGLVEEHGVDGPHALEGEAILDEDAGARGHRRRQGDHERDREAERVGAGDHEHGDGALERLVGIADCEPGDERHDAGAERRIEEHGGGAVGEGLGPRPRRLRIGDQSPDARERGVVTDRLDPHAHRGIGGDRAGDDAVTDATQDRPRLAGDHRLVERRRAVSIVPSAPASSPGRTSWSPTQIGDGPPGPAPATPVDVEQGRGRRVEGARRLPDRLHLLPVTEQHHVDQQHELPPVEIEQVGLAREARGERHGDREEINSIIPGARSRSSFQPPLRKGEPPYAKTAVPKTSGIHRSAGTLGAE